MEEAKRRVGDLIDQMHSGDSAMLISFSDTARVEQNFTDNRQQLREALAAIKPSQHSTNLSEALKLAAGLVNPGQANENSTDLHVAGTKLFIFSDGRFPPVQNFELGNLEPTFVPIGRSDAANVGVVAFGVSRSEDGELARTPGLRPIEELRPGGSRCPAETLRQRPDPAVRRRPFEHPAGRDPGAGLRPAGLRLGRFAP